MYLPDYNDGNTLCGVAFDIDGDLWGEYFVRNYNHACNTAPEYQYGKATISPWDFKLQTYPGGIKHFTKRPATDCIRTAQGYKDAHKSIDKCIC